MNNEKKVGFISEINKNNVVVKIPIDDISSNINNYISNISIDSILYTIIGNNSLICLNVTKIIDSKRQKFDSIEWVKNDILLVCEYIGTYSMDNDTFENEIVFFPIINSQVFYAGKKIISKIFNENLTEYHVVLGYLSKKREIKFYLDLNKIIAKHTLIVGNTGSGKSRTLLNIINLIQNYKIRGKNLEPKLILIEPYGEFNTEYIKNSIFYDSALPKMEDKELPKLSIYNKEYGLDIYEILNLLNLTPTATNKILENRDSFTNIEDILKYLIDYRDNDVEKNGRFVKSDIPKIQRYFSSDFFIKLLNNKEDNFVKDFFNSKKSVLVIKQDFNNELDLIFFTLITKAIYKYCTDINNSQKKHVMLAIDESHRIFSKNNLDSTHLYYLNLLIREGRKFNFNSILLTQSPSDFDSVALGQFNNFIIHKTFEQRDLNVIDNIVKGSNSYIDEIKYLSSGTAMCSGDAFKVATLVKMNEVPDLNIIPVIPIDTWIEK